MKRRALSVLFSLFFCLCIVSSTFLGVNAADEQAITENLDNLFTTSADLYSYDVDNVLTESTPDYILSNEEDYGISLMTVSSPNFTYDISKIDWYTDTPQQVRDVFEMAVSAAPTESTLQPFVAVYVISNTSALVLAGINVGGVVRVNTSNSSLNRFGLCYFGTVRPFTSHYLYQATFNANGERTGNWNQLAASDWGSVSSGRCMYYGGWIQPDYVRDVYVWGANGTCYHTDYTSLTVVDGTDSVYQFYTRFNATSGGYNGSLIPSAYSSAFPNVYESTLTVPSFEQWQAAQQDKQHEETKGLLGSIIDWIKQVPTLIIDGLKSLFIPEEGFFSSYFDDLNEFFEDRFGILYEIPEFIVTIFTKLVTFNPKTEDYTMTFPAIQAPEFVDGSIVWHTVSEEKTFTFDFLNEQPYSTLYSAYLSLIWLSYIGLLINLIRKKSHNIWIGGGSD